MIINRFSIENNIPDAARITLHLIHECGGFTYEDDYGLILEWREDTKGKASETAMLQYSAVEWGMEIEDTE